MLSITSVFLFIFGAISGSFAVASVWRIRADQLVEEKQNKNKDYDKLVKKNQLAKIDPKNDYSRCLSCGSRLVWYDMIPIVSWVCLGGKCRKCKSPIGLTEFMAEIVLGTVFSISYLFWPIENSLSVISFGVWIAWLIVATILFIYDLKWMELPIAPLYLSIGLAFLFAILNVLGGGLLISLLTELVLSIVILAGTYWILHIASNGKWVGSGDAFVGLAVALLLGDWRLSFITLFLANLLGSLVVIPSLISKKTNFSSRVPMGPLLIAAGALSLLFGQFILSYFISL